VLLDTLEDTGDYQPALNARGARLGVKDVSATRSGARKLVRPEKGI
jgi:hypothetical protein